MIQISVLSASTIDLNLRLRASGTDASGSDYFSIRNVFRDTSILTFNSTATSFLQAVNNFDTTNVGTSNINIFNPFETKKTSMTVHGWRPADGFNYIGAGRHNLTNSYDGFSFIATSSNFTGSISVYGYAKA